MKTSAGAGAPYIESPPIVVERDEDGQYQIGWHEDADGPFPSREFAEEVARRKAVRQ